MKNSLLYPVSTSSRRTVSLDGMWKFQFDPGKCRKCIWVDKWLAVAGFHASTIFFL